MFSEAQMNDLNGGSVMWFVFALLSAVFAALTSILAKIGIEEVSVKAVEGCVLIGAGTLVMVL